MFPYYGEKRELAHLYPEPEFDVIIEPFAGSASYSLHGDRWRRRVHLIERDPRIAGVWRWLIEDASEADIRALPDIEEGGVSDDLLHVMLPATRAASRGEPVTVTPGLARAWQAARQRMADTVARVKHWTIQCGDFTQAPDMAATWFIDPPYQGEPGRSYRFGSDTIDPVVLAGWVRSRSGQVIACEGGFGDYLPFAPLRPDVDVAGRARDEFVWHRSASTTGTGATPTR